MIDGVREMMDGWRVKRKRIPGVAFHQNTMVVMMMMSIERHQRPETEFLSIEKENIGDRRREGIFKGVEWEKQTES